jgi:dienelactone hydrolase
MGPAASSGARDPQVPIEVVRPEGAGPFPAVVWMHSCAGVVRGARHMSDWGRRLVRLGYLVAIPDSFSPRGYHNGVCGYGGQVPARIRADDAYAAMRHVENLPNVHGDKIGLMGHSHGAGRCWRPWTEMWPPKLGRQRTPSTASPPGSPSIPSALPEHGLPTIMPLRRC